MKILYDSVSSEYRYPLSKRDVGRVRNHIPLEIWDAILYIRFGFSAKTTRAARMVKRGRFYRIRINFCLKQVKGHLQSPLLFDNKQYIEYVKRYGGRPNLSTRTIDWDLKDAKRYSYYLLLHEIGHVVNFEKHPPDSISRRRDPKEEEWCDNYSAQMMKKMEL